MGTISKVTAGGGTHYIASTAYCYCDTAAGTAAKVAKVIGDQADSASTAAFTLIKGTTVHVKFVNSNTVANPTLAVGGTTAKSIMRYGTTAVSTSAATSWTAGAVVSFTYDGTNWVMNSGWDNNTTYSAATSSANGLMSSTDKTKMDGMGMVSYGTCSTAAATAEKEVTISNSNWQLKVGSIIGVKFTNSNTYSATTSAQITLNVNGTGAKSIWYNNAIPTGSSTSIFGYANRHIFYMYDGTYWVWINMGALDGNSNTVPQAQCETAAATAAKVATMTNFTLTAKAYLMVNVRYANTSKTALTLNVNSKGAKPIYINGSASSTSNYTLPASSYLVYYDGTNFYFRTDGKITGNITGDAATVNGHTVQSNVPANAVFTDLTYSVVSTF